MQAVILNTNDIKRIHYSIEKAKEYLQEIVDRTIKEGKAKGIYAPGFDYPARESSFAMMELDKILETINKE